MDQIKQEIKLTLQELDYLINIKPENKYYKTLRSSIEAIERDINEQWPLDHDKTQNIKGFSAYVAKQLDYPTPEDDEYNLWLHIANIEEYTTGEK